MIAAVFWTETHVCIFKHNWLIISCLFTDITTAHNIVEVNGLKRLNPVYLPLLSKQTTTLISILVYQLNLSLTKRKLSKLYGFSGKL